MKVHNAQGPDRRTRDHTKALPRGQHPLPLRPPTSQPPRYVAIDAHAATLSVAIAEPDGPVHFRGTIAHQPDAIRTLAQQLTKPGHPVVACYEAGPTGYGLARTLTRLGVPCTVVAPSLVPDKTGVRVKTDRRDALKLAHYFRSGDLTAVWIPDATHEALRDLVRLREDARSDHVRAKHRLTKFLLRHDLRRPATIKTSGTTRYRAWLQQLVTTEPLFTDGPMAEPMATTLLDYVSEIDRQQERVTLLDAAVARAVPLLDPTSQAVIAALQCARGVALITAATLVAEVGRLSRFPKPSRLMGYTGLVPREDSSGATTRRGRITKTGNAHLRRVLIEAAWSYRFVPKVSAAIRERQRGQPDAVKRIAWRAQQRLGKRFRRLTAAGKPRGQVLVAVARELVGFLWAMAWEIERPLPMPERPVS